MKNNTRERDRLIDLIRQSHCVEVWDYYNDDFKEPNPIETLADYLIKNGVVLPPCMVGDTVYCINTLFPNDPRINRCEVDALHITSGKNKIGHKKPSYALVRDGNMKSLSARIYFESFGKTVFLTKDQVEQKLNELGKDNAE